MIAKLGFVKVGEQVDEVDGLEWVHRLDLTTPNARPLSVL
jgi:hypothetical protein